jgi:hypothetical protein
VLGSGHHVIHFGYVENNKFLHNVKDYQLPKDDPTPQSVTVVRNYFSDYFRNTGTNSMSTA